MHILYSPEEYDRLPAPEKLERFPADLANPNLEYTGIYEDGWLIDHALFGLKQSEKADTLVVRGMVPHAQFTTILRVTIDRRYVGWKELAAGDFELKLPVLPGAKRRRVELRFSDVKTFSKDDPRQAAALLRFVGFTTEGRRAPLPPDITDQEIALGDGWYPPEIEDGKPHRWVNNNAELYLKLPEGSPKALVAELEPGPGLDLKPFELLTLDEAGKLVARTKVAGRQTVSIILPSTSRGQNTRRQDTKFKLVVEGGGKQTPHERRILNFRVFQLKFVAPPQDIVALDGNVGLGSGWYDLETQDGQPFRWVNNDTEVVITLPPQAKKESSFLLLKLESGPGLDGQPFTLQLLNSGGQRVAKTSVKTRDAVSLPVPLAPGLTGNFKLHVVGGGKPTRGETRILNFRVFTATLGSPALLKTLLIQHNLPASGLYEDGWASRAVSLQLPQLESPAVLAVRGFVPLLKDKEFTTEAQLLVDGREVARQQIKPGDFELRSPAPPGTGKRRVELRFTRLQSLPGEDQRPVSALLRFVGFEAAASSPTTGARTETVADIAAEGITFGDGWYPPETYQNQTFRWVDNYALFTVTAPAGAQQLLALELEPGPGLESKPFELQVLDQNGKITALVNVTGRETVRLSLPVHPDQQASFRLRVEGGGKPTPNDLRILNFRVFKLAWVKP